MLTLLSTVKSRLAINEFDLQYDAILTNAIKAISARFDRECNRTLARTVGATEEFFADQTAICPACYPIEAVTKFELKCSEAEGWLEQAGVDYLIRRSCVLSLAQPLYAPRSTLHAPQSRVTYTGGYVLPG